MIRLKRKQKKVTLFSVKVRLKSNEPNTVYKPAIKQGVVFSSSAKLAENKALEVLNGRLQEENGYAEIISISKIREDFVLKVEE